MKLGQPLSAVGAALALGLLGATAGCGQGSGSASPSEGSVTVRVTADYDTLDPYKGLTSAAFALNVPSYDRMVASDDQGRISPYLAKSWNVTPTSVKLTVRDDVTCADGSPLTPADMAASLKRYVSPKTKASSLHNFFGPGPFTVTTSGDTVTLRTETATGTLLAGLSNVAIICPAGIENPDALADKPAGSGPYELTDAKRGTSYTFTRRKGWSWGPARAAKDLPQTITYRVVANDSTAANLLSTGDLDIAQVTGPDAKRLTADSALSLHPVRDFGMTFMQFNEVPGRVTADEAVRRALSQAIDRDAWNKAANNGKGHPSPSIFPTNVECYDATTVEADAGYDPDAAKAAFEQAGWQPAADGTLTKDGKPLTIKVIGWEGSQLGPDYVVAALEKIGVKATLRKTDVATFVESAQKGDFDISIVPSQAPAPLKTANPTYLIGDGGTEGINWGRASNSEAERWIGVAGRSVGKAECAAWSKAQKAFAEHADAKPLASESFSWFARKGLDFSAVGPILLPWSIEAG